MTNALAAYLAQPSNPAPDSPVANVMVHLLERDPNLNLDVCRQRSLELLADAAKRRQYAIRFPAFDRPVAA
jgi:hypothetical protein